MPNNVGEQILDALLALGYTIEIADDGAITATQGTETIRGKAEHGAIEWKDRSQTFRVIEQAYLLRLRQHVAAFAPAQAQVSSNGTRSDR